MNRRYKHLSHTLLHGAVLLGVMLAGIVAVEAEELPRAQLLAQNCAACHGVNGREFNESMPPLAGMQTEQFVRAMTAFQQGARPAIIMDRVARGYNRAEIEAMAQFFAAQPATQYK